MQYIKRNTGQRWIRQVIVTIILALFLTIAGVYHTGEATDQSEFYEKLKILSEVLYLIQKYHVDEIDGTSLIYGAVDGMVQTLHTDSTFMQPEVYQDMQTGPRENVGGIGIQVLKREGQLTVIAPIDETPAYYAGIRAGDRIINIDGQSTKNMSLMEAVKLLRGPIGSILTITIMRDSITEPKNFSILRDFVEIRPVISKMLDNDIGYIRLRQFQEEIADEFEETLNDLEESGMKGLILDLRDNPGGLLNAVVEVADKFLEKGKLIVYTEGRNEKQNMRFVAQEDTSYHFSPLIVLVNHGTAAGSEIMASALQEQKHALILGTSTFGKGYIYSVIPLSNNSGLRLATARYFTPQGRIIEGHGIIPDILVEQPEIEGTVKFGDIESDVQLQKAMDIMRQEQLATNDLITMNTGRLEERMNKTKTVVIRNTKDADDTRYLGARLNSSGDLLIEGHDIGPGVSKVFGGGLDEYEWSYTVKSKDLLFLIRALGGKEGDDILDLIVDRCTGERAVDLEEVIRKDKIPHEFWNWITE